MSELINIHTNSERVRAGMRWFGPEDVATIQNIRQTPGVTNVISALHHIPAGDIWTEADVAQRKIEVEFIANPAAPSDLDGMALFEWHRANSEPTGLIWDTAESLIFTEDIKNGSELRDLHIANYNQSLRNLGKFGVINVVGNFMLVADWTRTGMATLPDGSSSLQYINAAFAAFDIYLLKRHDSEQAYIDDGSFTADEVAAARSYWNDTLQNDAALKKELTDIMTAGLPGAQAGFTLEDFRAAVAKYADMDEDELRTYIAYFLEHTVPVAKEAGVRLCCHSDDPAFTPFLGTPRTVGGSKGYQFLLDHGCGANFCIGSLMANEDNRDITVIIREIADYGFAKGLSIDEIFPHIHLRPVETDGKNFREGHHAEHREELAKVAHTLVDLGWQGVFRPDHAPSSDHGFGRPGYDVIGRGYGANLLLGLFEMAAVAQATRADVVDAVIAACQGDEALRDTALQAARDAEIEAIRKKVAFIKRSFAHNAGTTCAHLS